MIKGLFKTMRPRQWAKNIFIFAALVFDKQLFVLNSLLRTLEGFLLFCLISSAVYIFNDIADRAADAEHRAVARVLKHVRARVTLDRSAKFEAAVVACVRAGHSGNAICRHLDPPRIDWGKVTSAGVVTCLGRPSASTSYTT